MFMTEWVYITTYMWREEECWLSWNSSYAGFWALAESVGNWIQVSARAATELTLLAISSTPVFRYISHICYAVLY